MAFGILATVFAFVGLVLAYMQWKRLHLHVIEGQDLEAGAVEDVHGIDALPKEEYSIPPQPADESTEEKDVEGNIGTQLYFL
jgi:hypothetical protein